MKIKKILWVLLFVTVFVLGFILAYNAATMKYRSEIIRLNGEVEIYKNEAEKYSQTLRTIRETATQATILDKAK